MLLNLISVPVFLISFAVGLFFVYILGPEMKTIFIYPTPENIDRILFKDKAENCFSFQEEIVDCQKDESLITKIPIKT